MNLDRVSIDQHKNEPINPEFPSIHISNNTYQSTMSYYGKEINMYNNLSQVTIDNSPSKYALSFINYVMDPACTDFLNPNPLSYLESIPNTILEIENTSTNHYLGMSRLIPRRDESLTLSFSTTRLCPRSYLAMSNSYTSIYTTPTSYTDPITQISVDCGNQYTIINDMEISQNVQTISKPTL